MRDVRDRNRVTRRIKKIRRQPCESWIVRKNSAGQRLEIVRRYEKGFIGRRAAGECCWNRVDFSRDQRSNRAGGNVLLVVDVSASQLDELDAAVAVREELRKIPWSRQRAFGAKAEHDCCRSTNERAEPARDVA